MFGCATVPISEGQSALNTCFFAEDQAGWSFLQSPPPRADALRAAIVASGERPFPEPNDNEMWFLNSDGHYVRCNYLGPAFHEKGTPAICAAMIHTLIPSADSWSVKGGPLMMCHKHR
jgi:hypothetical protein